jgi:hypothetical protein
MYTKMIGIILFGHPYCIQKLVDFTLNTKYAKDPHENILKTQQNLSIH